MTTYELAPEQFGLPRAKLSDLVVRNVEEAAEAVRSVLEGRKGPRRDIVSLNAGAAVMVAGLAPDLQAGIRRAAEAIDSGAAEGARRADTHHERMTVSDIRIRKATTILTTKGTKDTKKSQ